MFFRTPDALPGHGFCIRVKQIFFRIENQPVFRFIGSVHPVGIFKFFDIKLEYDHRKDISDPVSIWKL